MGHQGRTVDRVIGTLASAAHGVVARRDLLEAGITSKEIRVRLRSGRLLTEHRGVYRVGHRAPSVEARYLAAVLACGDGAALCGLAAAHLFELVKHAVVPEVLAPTERRVPGIVVHRSRRGDHPDLVEWRCVPTTSVARTLVDLAATLDEDTLARACHEAGVLHRTTPLHVEGVLARRPTSAGAQSLRRVLHGDVPVTLSRLEELFLKRLRDADLPSPVTNRVANGRRGDARWPEHRITIEVDGFHFHNTRHAWERDRHREREAYARGDHFRRYTYGDVVEHPGLMLRELTDLLKHPA